jgi:hypothetical protein
MTVETHPVPIAMFPVIFQTRSQNICCSKKPIRCV